MEKKELIPIALVVLIFVVFPGLATYYVFMPDNPRISYVADGDTLVAGGDWIRLARIDTPESWEPGYEEAKQWLQTYEGEKVRLECHGVGYYGREICEVYHDGKNLNDELLDRGLAEPYEK